MGSSHDQGLQPPGGYRFGLRRPGAHIIRNCERPTDSFQLRLSERARRSDSRALAGGLTFDPGGITNTVIDETANRDTLLTT